MDTLAVLAIALGAVAVVTGLRQMRRALRAATARRLVRGIRRLVTGAALLVAAVRVLGGQPGLIVFAAVFLAEELYETGVLLLVLPRGEP